jgi:flagellin
MQRATLETNITVLNDTLAALTEAESQIRDTDFAEETSNLTRAQILVQANMNTLGIANQIPNYNVEPARSVREPPTVSA